MLTSQPSHRGVKRRLNTSAKLSHGITHRQIGWTIGTSHTSLQYQVATHRGRTSPPHGSRSPAAYHGLPAHGHQSVTEYSECTLETRRRPTSPHESWNHLQLSLGNW